MVQWLGLGASTVRGPDSIPGPGTKILKDAPWPIIIIIISKILLPSSPLFN